MKDAIRLLRQSITEVSRREDFVAPLHRVLNEWEVVFLLGAIAKDAGFFLVQGSDAYPDAVLEVEVRDGEWQKVRAEIEYRLSRFHHDPTGCDLVICWRKDRERVKGNLPVIELYSLFSHLDAETDGLEIDHSQANPVLVEIFEMIQDWLEEMGTRATGTGSTTNTNTRTFKIKTGAGERSLCSLQYYNQKGYLQFKWFRDTLDELGKLDLFMTKYAMLPKEMKREQTSKELRINIHPQDNGRIQRMLEEFDFVFR